MKKILCLFLLILIVTGCTNNKLDIHKIMSENEYIIIDVRTYDEYLESHVKDAINIPYDEIDETIELDDETVVFVYCQSGRRSQIAKETLDSLGYTVYDLGAYNNVDLEKE